MTSEKTASPLLFFTFFSKKRNGPKCQKIYIFQWTGSVFNPCPYLFMGPTFVLLWKNATQEIGTCSLVAT